VVEREVSGEELLGLRYLAPYKFMQPESLPISWSAPTTFTTTDGTGIVHIAPAFGEDDMRVGRGQRPAARQRGGYGGPLRRRR